MDASRKVNAEVKEKILNYFNLEKLCPKCGGPLEWQNEIHCEMCKLISTLRSQLVMIDTGVMQIRNRVGLSAKAFDKMKQKQIKPPIIGGDPDDEIPTHIK